MCDPSHPCCCTPGSTHLALHILGDVLQSGTPDKGRGLGRDGFGGIACNNGDTELPRVARLLACVTQKPCARPAPTKGRPPHLRSTLYELECHLFSRVPVQRQDHKPEGALAEVLDLRGQSSVRIGAEAGRCLRGDEWSPPARSRLGSRRRWRLPERSGETILPASIPSNCHKEHAGSRQPRVTAIFTNS